MSGYLIDADSEICHVERQMLALDVAGNIWTVRDSPARFSPLFAIRTIEFTV